MKSNNWGTALTYGISAVIIAEILGLSCLFFSCQVATFIMSIVATIALARFIMELPDK